MKKLVSLVLCLTLGCFILSGCSDVGEPFEDRTYTPEEKVSGVSIDVRDREIEVEPSADGQVHIFYSENSEEYYDIAVSGDGMLTMTGASGKDWTDYIGGKAPADDRRILLQVPDGILDSLALSTTNEDITLPELAVAGSISLTSNGGDIAFENLSVGSALTLNVKNGDISGAVAGGYDDFAIHTEIKKGKSSLPDSKDGGEKTLTVSCNNGDVNIELTGE